MMGALSHHYLEDFRVSFDMTPVSCCTIMWLRAVRPSGSGLL